MTIDDVINAKKTRFYYQGEYTHFWSISLFAGFIQKFGNLLTNEGSKRLDQKIDNAIAKSGVASDLLQLATWYRDEYQNSFPVYKFDGVAADREMIREIIYQAKDEVKKMVEATSEDKSFDDMVSNPLVDLDTLVEPQAIGKLL